MKTKVLDILTRNFWWRLVSLVIAVAIWLNVANEPEIATLVTAPVQYKEPSSDLEVTSRLIESVNLEARGPSGRLHELSATRTAVILDFSKIHEPGEHTFTLTRTDTNLPRGVELVRATPAQLRFTFERREKRRVPVEILLSGQPPKGLRLVSSQAFPADQEIAGPGSRVERVNAVTTDTINLSSLRAPGLTRTVNIYIPEPQVRFTGPAQVTVKIVLK
jgi:YbbR domain-containing protein